MRIALLRCETCGNAAIAELPQVFPPCGRCGENNWHQTGTMVGTVMTVEDFLAGILTGNNPLENLPRGKDNPHLN